MLVAPKTSTQSDRKREVERSRERESENNKNTFFMSSVLHFPRRKNEFVFWTNKNKAASHQGQECRRRIILFGVFRAVMNVPEHGQIYHIRYEHCAHDYIKIREPNIWQVCLFNSVYLISRWRYQKTYTIRCDAMRIAFILYWFGNEFLIVANRFHSKNFNKFIKTKNQNKIKTKFTCHNHHRHCHTRIERTWLPFLGIAAICCLLSPIQVNGISI